VNRLEAALRAIALDLERVRTAWALVGGLAVSARAEPRFTRDIDLAVAAARDAEAGMAGNLTTDAHLAAVALELGASVCSTDADFGRFPGVERISPLPTSIPSESCSTRWRREAGRSRGRTRPR